MPMKQNFFFDIILKHTVQNAQFQNLRLVYDKNCWFYKYAKFSYFTIKNGIRITWPKCHMTSTCDVSLCDSWDQANMARMKKAAEWKGGQYCVADAPNKQSAQTIHTPWALECTSDLSDFERKMDSICSKTSSQFLSYFHIYVTMLC